MQKILEKLEKLDMIEMSSKKIESKLANLEIRTANFETFKEEAKKDINDLKGGAKFTGKQLQEKSQELEKVQAEIANLMGKGKNMKRQLKRLNKKKFYLEAFSRREDIVYEH